jgi:putative FmdB family regulatory protein
MPIYEYKCDKCQKIVEVMQKFTDKPLSRCPSCGGRVSRLISNCSFQLKGSGWYVPRRPELALSAFQMVPDVV